MKSYLDYRENFLCVVVEDVDRDESESSVRRSWYPVYSSTLLESRALAGRLVSQVDPFDRIYLDEEANVYQLKDKGETKPIAVDHLPGTEKTELEALLEASLNGEKTSGETGGPKQLFKKKRGSRRTPPNQQGVQVTPAPPDPYGTKATPPIEPVAPVPTSPGTEDFVRLNLRQK